MVIPEIRIAVQEGRRGSIPIYLQMIAMAIFILDLLYKQHMA
jgi:hypothetical protein